MIQWTIPECSSFVYEMISLEIVPGHTGAGGQWYNSTGCYTLIMLNTEKDLSKYIPAYEPVSLKEPTEGMI